MMAQSPNPHRAPSKERQGLTIRCARSGQDYLLMHIIRGFAPFVLPVQFVKLCQIFGNSSAILDRIYRINKIKATLFHPDYPVNPVKN